MAVARRHRFTARSEHRGAPAAALRCGDSAPFACLSPGWASSYAPILDTIRDCQAAAIHCKFSRQRHQPLFKKMAKV